MVKSIAVSDEAYKKVMTTKREMEEREGKVVPIGDALDELLGVV